MAISHSQQAGLTPPPCSQLLDLQALELIRKHSFSTAIFAPGWVYESHDDKNEFCNNQDKFWALLSDFLYVHSPSSPLPFISSFCQGFGRALYWRGQEELSRRWFNLSGQEIQSLYYTKELESQGWLRTRGCPQDAWNGGCSLLIEGLIPCSQSRVCAKIFTLHVPLAFSTFVSLVYKSSTGVTVSLELKTSDATICTQKGLQEIPTTTVSAEALENEHHLVRQFSQSCGTGEANGWTVRCSQLELQGCVLREVGVCIVRDGEPKDTPFSCRVGEIMVLDASSLVVTSEAIEGMCVYDVVWLKGLGAAPDSVGLLLNATLRWRFPTQLVRYFRVYWRRLRGPNPRIPPGELVLLGRSYSMLFRVAELLVPNPPGLLELVVQPVTKEGFLIPENKWGRQSLSYTEK